MNENLGALNQVALSTWERVTREPVQIATAETDTIIIAAEEPDLIPLIGSIYRHGSQAIVAADHRIGADFEQTLAGAGFSLTTEKYGFSYRGPAPRPPSQNTELAVAGPLAARLYAGAGGATSATAADLGIRHRQIATDHSPPTRWLGKLSGEGPRSAANPPISVFDLPPMVVPLSTDGRRPIVIHRQTPQPILLVGDTTAHEVSSFLNTLQPSGVEYRPTLVRGSGPLNDAVAVVRNARERLWIEMKRSSGVIAPRHLFRSEIDRAAVVVDAASRGIPVMCDHAASVSRYLGNALMEVLTTVSFNDFDDLIYRDETGVRMHRAVNADIREDMRNRGLHGIEPSVTVILPTIRPHLVGGALEQISRQRYPAIEVVVALHGEIDPNLKREWEATVGVPMTVIAVDPARSLGDLYNEAMSVGSGDIVTIMDDDDFYGVNHVVDLVDALIVSQAQMVGKGAEFFHLAGLDMTIQRSPEGRYGYTSFIGGSSLTIRRQTLVEIGGFRPITLGVDRATIGTIERMGGRVYRAHGYGYVVGRRVSGHTWDPGDQYFVDASVRQIRGLARFESGLDTETG